MIGDCSADVVSSTVPCSNKWMIGTVNSFFIGIVATVIATALGTLAAASVPRAVAITVATIPIKKLFTVPIIHLFEQGTVDETTSALQSPIMFLYHLNDHASGSGGHQILKHGH